eukprot:353923-Chlamydomonas_euryale.AAC.3
MTCMRQELGRLDDDANVFKMIGPAMIKQDLVEAKSNINKRIEYIKGEIGRTDGKIKGIEGKLKEKEAEVSSVEVGSVAGLAPPRDRCRSCRLHHRSARHRPPPTTCPLGPPPAPSRASGCATLNISVKCYLALTHFSTRYPIHSSILSPCSSRAHAYAETVSPGSFRDPLPLAWPPPPCVALF